MYLQIEQIVFFAVFACITCCQKFYSVQLFAATLFMMIYFVAAQNDTNMPNAIYFSISGLCILGASFIQVLCSTTSLPEKKLQILLLCAIIFAWLLLGLSSLVVLCIAYMWILCTIRCCAEASKQSINATFRTVVSALQVYFVGKLLFFLSGHRYDFGTLQVKRSYDFNILICYSSPLALLLCWSSIYFKLLYL